MVEFWMLAGKAAVVSLPVLIPLLAQHLIWAFDVWSRAGILLALVLLAISLLGLWWSSR
jgi:hypothetical protein